MSHRTFDGFNDYHENKLDHFGFHEPVVAREGWASQFLAR